MYLFQSTLPRVERPFDRLADGLPSDISIHAPASGATPRILQESIKESDFNPRSREWSDGTPLEDDMWAAIFQSTLPRVERRKLLCNSCTLYGFQSTLPRVERRTAARRYRYTIGNFNPRSREWSDRRSIDRASSIPISIHAPASGATAFIDIFSFTVRLYFISSH